MNDFGRVIQTLMLFGYLQLTRQHCYVMKPLNFSKWDTPNYGLEMKMFAKNCSLSSVTIVRKDVAIPLWQIILFQHPNKKRSSTRLEQPRVLYNSTMKTCEFWKFIRRVNAWSNIAKIMLSGSGSNMSLACPLKVGVYIMSTIQVPPDTAILKFMYQPNAVYSVHGTVYSLDPEDGVTKRPVCSYVVNTTIIKTC